MKLTTKEKLSILIAACIVFIEFCVPVCETVYIEDYENKYAQIMAREKNIACDVSIVGRQVTTDGTSFRVKESTNNSFVGDVMFYGIIDPKDLAIDDIFMFRGITLIVKSPKVFGGIRIKDLTIMRPYRVIMIAESSTYKKRYYVKDLSARGHIKFYLGLLNPIFKCTL